MKNLLLAVLMCALTSTVWARPSSNLQETGRRIQELERTAQEVGDPRLATVGHAQALKSLRGTQRLEILQLQHQEFVDSVYEELAPKVPRWKASRIIGEKFEAVGVAHVSVWLSLIEEFFVMPQLARRDNPKKILQHLEQRGVNPAYLRRLPEKKQLAQLDDSLKLLALVRYLEPKDTEVLNKLEKAEKFTEKLLVSNANVETRLYTKARWPGKSTTAGVKEAALQLLTSSSVWKNSGFEVLEASPRGRYYPYWNGPSRRFAHRVLVAHSSRVSARSAEMVELVFLTPGDKKEARFTDFFVDEHQRFLRETP